MMLLWLIYMTTSLLYSLASKNCSNVIQVEKGTPAFAIYTGMVAVFACAFFFVCGGFSLTVNLPSLLYALWFSVLCIGSLFLNLKVYLYYPIANVNVINSIGSILLTTLAGVLWLNEKMTVGVMIRCALVIVVVTLVFLSGKHSEKSKEQPSDQETDKTPAVHKSKWQLCYLIGMPVMTAIVFLTMKGFSMIPGKISDTSFCFFANVFMFLYALIWLPLCLCKNKTSLRAADLHFGRRELLATLFIVLSSNTVSLLEFSLVARTDMVVFTPVSTAITILVSVVSSLIYKEKLNVYSVLAILLSLAVIFINF